MKSKQPLNRAIGRIGCAALALVLSGCAGHFRPKTHTQVEPIAAALPPPAESVAPAGSIARLTLPRPGLSQSLTEIAFDGRHPVPSNGSPVNVDAHSVLFLQFPQIVRTDAVGSASPEWEPIVEMLTYFDQAAKRMNEINSRQPRSAAERKQLQQDAAAAASRAANMVRELLSNKSLKLDQVEIADIVGGLHPAFAGANLSTNNGYVNLALWLNIKMQERRDALQTLATNQQVKVSVQAFRDSNGAKSALHVDGWDTFAEGPYEPIDRTGLRPTPADQERLNAERARAESTKELVESIMEKDGSLRQTLKALPGEAEQILNQLAGRLTSFPSELAADQFKTLTNKLADLAGADAQSPAAKLLGELKVFQADVVRIKMLGDSVRTLTNLVKNLKQARPDELIFGSENLFAQAGGALQIFIGIATNLPTLPDRIKRIQEALPLVADSVLQGQAEAAMQSVTNFLGAVGTDFAEKAGAVIEKLNKFLGTALTLQVTTSIKKPEGDWLIRTPDNLVPGRLDLRRSHVALGDLVSIRVRATNEATGELVEPVLYETEVGLMGLHGKPAVHFIMARALSGPAQATQWKPNVAAAVEWHYTKRDPHAWGKTWNWLYPGVGIHLASLDQGDDSVELGAGGIISLWDGLLTGGFGYNFSNNSDHEYVFVGVNLLSLLQQGKKQFRHD